MGWRVTPATVPPVLVDAWLPRAAERHPDRPAVNALTYAELLGEVDATARRLAGRGVRAGDRVGLALAPGEAFCIALHAILRLGAVAVPVDLRLSARERERVVQDTVEVIDGAVIGTPASQARLRERHDLDAPAIVVHTSGTSGTPKAVELTYGNWLWSALGSAVALGLDPAERWLCALPLSHVGGLSIVMRSAIYATTAIVHERFDTDRVLDALVQEDGPTIASLVPTTLQRLLDAGLREPPALRWALLGGAPATTALQGRAAAAGVPVATTYGLTESCSQVTTLGAPLFCTRVRMAGDGEILVSGPTVAPGAGPVLATGDLGSGAPTARWPSPGARPTRSSPAARTWRRPRSRRCSRRIPTSSRRPSTAARTPSGARRSWRPSSPIPTSRPRSCARGARSAWRRSRCPRRSPSRWRCRARRRARSRERTCNDSASLLDHGKHRPGK